MFILFLVLWIILNGKITLEITLFGIVISFFINLFMIKFLDYKPAKIRNIKKIKYAISYFIQLMKDIIIANYQVIRFILSDIKIQPQLIIFKVPLKTELAKTVLANSITLAPGTIAVDVKENIFYVHALDYTFAEDLENSKLICLLKEMEA